MSFIEEDNSDLDIGFNVNNIEVQAFDIIPDGVYVFNVIKVRVDPTKDGTGKRLNVELAIVGDGQFNGRRVFDGLNIRNKNPKAEAIGREQCAALFKSCGVGGNDASALVGCSGKMKLGTQPADGQYEARNVVKRYLFDAQSAPASKSADAAPAAPGKRKPPAFMGNK